MTPNKNTFCVAPYRSIYLSSTGQLSPCCYTQTNYNFDKIEDYYQSTSLNNLRKNLSNGVKDIQCKKCWITEDNGGDSLRLILNRTLGKDITQAVNNLDTKNIKSFELVLGNFCNLKCIMCNPSRSSQLLAEANLNNDIKKFYSKDIKFNPASYNWPKQQNFIDWCNKFLPQSIHIQFTGGEPFINPWLIKTLENIPTEQKNKCILHFTTNLTILNDEIINILKKFKEIWISVSVEGTDSIFEHIRYGHNWKTIKDNIEKIINLQNNIKLSINYVVQSLTILSIEKMVKYFDLKRIKIKPLILTSPAEFSLPAIKEKYKQDLLNKFENYNGYNINFIDTIKSVVRKNIKHNTKLAKKCVDHLTAIDKARKTNFQKIIPVDYFI